jgi:hypothetical protein
VAPDAARADFHIRYDDLTQHAHVKQVTLPMVLARVCMEKIWAKHPLFETRKQGIVPILSRIVIESEPVAVSFGSPLEGRGHIEIAHERDAQGAVSALFLNSYAEVFAIPSRRNRDVDPATRQPVHIGRAFGEHVLTKPFGPVEERKVLSFAVPGQPSIPELTHRRVRVDANVELPPGAEPLDAELSPDPAPWTFGLIHTDLNQHVNSLVYARMFEEAAVRRAALHGFNRGLFAHKLSLCYRKPCFAGETLTCMLRGYQLNGAFGVVGYLAPPNTPASRANCSFNLLFGSPLHSTEHLHHSR